MTRGRGRAPFRRRLDAAGYITGEVVTIDGGRWMGSVGGSMVKPLYDWGDAEWARFRAYSANATKE